MVRRCTTKSDIPARTKLSIDRTRKTGELGKRERIRKERNLWKEETKESELELSAKEAD
jgi:hypothetical protein